MHYYIVYRNQHLPNKLYKGTYSGSLQGGGVGKTNLVSGTGVNVAVDWRSGAESRATVDQGESSQIVTYVQNQNKESKHIKNLLEIYNQ